MTEEFSVTTVDGVRLIDGHTIIMNEATALAFKPGGKASAKANERIRSLLLDDDRVVYGCSECDYVRSNMRAIAPHLKRHYIAPFGKYTELTITELLDRLGKLLTPVSGNTLSELSEILSDPTQELEELEHWRSRALKAERALKAYLN